MSLDRTYPAVPASVPRARLDVAALAAAAVDTEELDRVRLAVSEAVTNAVEHGYPGREGEIHLAAALIAGQLSVLIADDGVGLDSPRRGEGLGLGMVLIAQSADALTIRRRASGGVEVDMRFDIDARRAPAAASASRVASVG